MHVPTLDEICAKPAQAFGIASLAYKAPTENARAVSAILSECYPLRQKKVLTLASSGDLIIGFLIEGACLVTGVDISAISCMWIEFRIQARLSLGLRRFNILMRTVGSPCPQEVGSATTKTIAELSLTTFPLLNDQTVGFLDLSRVCSGGLFRQILHPKSYPECFQIFNKTLNMDPWLLRRVRILNTPIQEYVHSHSHRFDMIYCSNLFDCELYGLPPRADMFKRFGLLSDLHAAVRDGGIIVTYLFGDALCSLGSLFAAASLLGLGVSVHKIPGHPESHDYVIVYSCRPWVCYDYLRRLFSPKSGSRSIKQEVTVSCGFL